MKTTLVPILTIATLATSLSAFAATDEPKPDNSGALPLNSKKDARAYAHKETKQKKAKSQRDDERRNRKRSSTTC